MKIIKVLGSDEKAILLEFHVKTAIMQLGWDASIEKVTDIKEIQKYKIYTLPALIINEKLILKGTTPTTEELKQILKGFKFK